MTREELKEHCEKQIEMCELWAISKGEKPSGKIYEEHTLILELLEQEPCEDCISRQAVLDAMFDLCDTGETLKENPWRDNPHIDAVVETIERLPSVKLQEPCEDWYDVLSNEMTLDQARQAVKDLRKKLAEHLEQEPCDVPDINVGDMISRQAVIGVIERWLECSDYNEAERHIMRAVQSVLYDSPSVNPQPKTGHWIAVYQGDEIINYRCSECELGDTNGSTNLYGWDYCRRCGAKMVESQESEEWRGMTRFSMFTDKELDAMESALCNEGLKYLVEELRIERRYRESRR